MLDTLETHAEQNEKIKLQRIKSNCEVEEKRIALEHEREMAKIRLAEARLKLEEQKLKLHSEAQLGTHPNGAGGVITSQLTLICESWHHVEHTMFAVVTSNAQE